MMRNKVLNTRGACILLLAGLVSTFSFISITKNCFSAAMVFIVEEEILTKFQTGAISAVFYFVYAILQMMSGPLTDRWRPDKLITIGLMGAGVSNLVIYLNQNYAVMMIAWIFNAVMQCAVWPSVFKIASTVIVDSMKGLALFFINVCGSIGSIVSLFIAAIVSSEWQLNFLISSIGLFAFALLWELCQLALKPHLKEREGERAEEPILASREQAPSFKTLLFSYGILLLFVIAIFRAAFDLGLKALTPSIINESYEALSPEFSTIISVVVMVAGIFGTLFAGIIYPRYVRNEAFAILLLFIIAFPFVALLLFVGTASYVWIIVFLAIIVFVLNVASMFTSTYIASRFGKWNMGATVAGFVNGGAALGIVVANMLFTAIADVGGWIYTIKVWVVLMAVAILLSLVFLYIWTRALKKR